MRFRFFFFGTSIFEVDLAWPARGMYPVPEEIYSEDEVLELFNLEDDDE